MSQAAAKTEPSLADVRAALQALKNLVGSKAYVSLTMSAGEQVCRCQLYPKDILGKEQIFTSGDDWLSAIQAAANEWAKRADLHAETTTREMALAIIRITAENGGCTDAQLRGAYFEASDVVRYCDAAVERANEMAAGAPFSVTATLGANEKAA